jgi:hypothetical protein
MQITHPQNVFKKWEKVNMSDDLVKRLRQLGDRTGLMFVDYDTTIEFADRIEKLEAALQIYSCDCSLASEEEDCELGDWTMLSCGYRARKALEGKDGT